MKTKTKPATKAQRAPRTAKEPEGEWLTPTQISHEPDMPPHAVQLIYGYIRQGKLTARRAEGVKGQLVDAVLAREALAQRGTRGGPRPPRAARPKAEPVLKPGAILSRESTKQHLGKIVPTGKRRLEVATEVGKYTADLTDGTRDQLWQIETLAKRIKEGTTQLEHVDNILAIVAYSWRVQGDDGLSRQLMEWCVGRVTGAAEVYNKLIGRTPKGLTQEGDEEDVDEQATAI